MFFVTTDRNAQVIELANLGYRLIPWQGRTNVTSPSRPLFAWKDRRLTPAEVEAWTSLRPTADWAIIPESTCVFDLEQKHGLDGRRDFEECLADCGLSWDRAIDGCAVTRTKSGGWHVWYRQPSNQQLVGGHHVRPGVECKAVNGSCHVPPSFGYVPVTRLGSPSELPEVPRGLADLWISAKSKRGTAKDYRRTLFGVGERRAMLCSCAGKLRDGLGMDDEELFASLIAIRDRRCEDPSTFTDDEIRGIARDFAKKEIHGSEALALTGDPVAKAVNRLLNR